VDVVGVRSPACQYLAHAVLSDASAVARRLGAAVRHVPLMVPIILGLLLIPSIWTASAQISDGVVRTGLLNDQSSIYVDDGGPGSVVAAHMAIKDPGKKRLGRPIELLVGGTAEPADMLWIEEKEIASRKAQQRDKRRAFPEQE
jgi:hypothetical protein